jgi:Polyketide cyclase / dehydrase and lipid transport
MSSNLYHFVTHWKLKASCTEVYEILSDAEGLARWWPSVYLDVKELEPGNGITGKRVALYTKGWLPYTLQWSFIVTENTRPHGFTIAAQGDFEGRGIWIFEQEGEDCHITFDWKLTAEKPLLKYLSFIMKPLFSANHKWAMKKGEESLQLELLRRRATSATALSAIAAPPAPTFPHNLTNNKKLSSAVFG